MDHCFGSGLVAPFDRDLASGDEALEGRSPRGAAGAQRDHLAVCDRERDAVVLVGLLSGRALAVGRDQRRVARQARCLRICTAAMRRARPQSAPRRQRNHLFRLIATSVTTRSGAFC
jgi:hypothetical protein